MSYTDDQQLELIPSGGADWDMIINYNFSVLERGHHFVAIAASEVYSGEVVTVTTSGALQTNANSALNFVHGISPTHVLSGEVAQFLHMGIIRNIDTWSGTIVQGQPVFVSNSYPGRVVSSFASHGPSIGWAISPSAILFDPTNFILAAAQQAGLTGVGSVMAQVNSAVTQMNSFSVAMTGTTESISSLQVDVGSIHTEIGSAWAAISSAQTAVSSFAASDPSAVTSLSARVSSLESRVTSIGADVTSLRAYAESTHTDLMAQQTTLNALSNSYTALNSLANPWEASVYVGTKPSSGEVLYKAPVTSPIRFLPGLPNWKMVVGTGATATTTLSVRKNGNQFGTVVVSAGQTGLVGAFSATNTTDLSSGDWLSLEAPTTQDSSFADFGIGVYASRR